MYDRFHSFARAEQVCTYENIFEERHDTIAKLIHYGYAEKYDPMALHDLSDPGIREKIDAKWYGSASLHDKLSSRAQAKHIDIKLKALGLARRPADDKPVKDLLAKNRTLLDEKLAADRRKTGIDDALLHPEVLVSGIVRRPGHGPVPVENEVLEVEVIPVESVEHRPHRLAPLTDQPLHHRGHGLEPLTAAPEQGLDGALSLRGRGRTGLPRNEVARRSLDQVPLERPVGMVWKVCDRCHHWAVGDRG
jgi:hypothetical protein